MTLDEIQRLIEMVQTSAVAELEYSHGEERIRIVREHQTHAAPQSFPHLVAHVPAPVAAPATGTAPATATAPATVGASLPPEAGAPAPEAPSNLREIKSPMVGTFYRAPAPEAAPYTEVGSRVVKGQIIGIIEAMKLMNEIPADVAGTVVEIPVDNAEPVEFGQVLIRVKPD